MSALSMFRTISHGVERLAWRHGGGGRPTDGWQDKSAAFGSALVVGRKRQFLASCRTALPALPIDIPIFSAYSPPSPS
jgi:hypothetical protein